MMRRLYSRIYFHLLAALCVTGIVSVAVFSVGWRKEFARHWATKFARHAAAVIGDFANQPVERDRVVRRMADELDVEVTVRDSAGHLLVAAGPELPPLSAGDLSGEAGLFGGKEWYTAALMHDDAGHVIGLVEAAPMRRLRPPNLWRPVIGVALVLALLAFFTAPLARRISRPVERLTEGSRRLAGGDLSYRVPMRKPRRPRHQKDQLDELTVAWNEMAERVEGLVRGQKELLANVSHELRSPLARLRVALELLPADEKRKAAMDTDLSELDSLIETLLTASRLEASGLPTHMGRVQVTQLFAELEDRAARDPNLAGKSVRIAAPPEGAATLDADGALLLRALWNLIDNAGKYGAPPITVEALPTGDSISFTVTDEGSGIPVAERSRVFEPFYRVESPGSPRRGFGLGLTLARRVAEVHGGAISIQSREGSDRGCRVTLRVPIKPA
jgi:signal transduction histidine kinase